MTEEFERYESSGTLCGSKIEEFSRVQIVEVKSRVELE